MSPDPIKSALAAGQTLPLDREEGVQYRGWTPRITALALVAAAILLAYLILVDPMGPGAQQCVKADHEPCADLLGARTRIVEHATLSSLHAVCGDERSDACALRSFSFSSAQCVIHLGPNTSALVLEHEKNHCRGWDHAGDSHAAYARPWTVNRDIWVVRAAYLPRP